MSSDWYYLVMGEAQGPINGKSLRTLARAGEIQPDTFVRRNGNDWVMADRIRGLFQRPRIPVRRIPTPLSPRRSYSKPKSQQPDFTAACCPHCGQPMHGEEHE